MLKLALTVLLLAATPAGAADFAVDLSRPLKPVDHAASGALYGIAAPGWPPQSFIDALHPKNFTQMAPGGQQLPNGETAPVGDALIVAPIAAEAGASVTIRLPDTFPAFPYVWRGPEFWATAIDRITKAVVAANPPNIYAYEIWNEPDWNWQAQWGDFNAIWATTAKAIRTADPSRRLMGPSASKWDAAYMRGFLTAAKASGTLPDIISWHELDPAATDNIEADVVAYRALEAELGLAPHPISVNEYGAPRAMAVPGALVHYIAQLERAGVDTADLAFWHRPGRLSDLLAPSAGGRGPATDPVPTGAYWLYSWYGSMSGSMVSATAAPGTGLDGFAAYDAGSHRATIIIGGAAGHREVTVSGLPAAFGPSVHVTATATHWTGTDGAAPTPERLFFGTFMVQHDAITVPVGLASADGAVKLELTAGSGGATTDTIAYPIRPLTQRIEAEIGNLTGGRKFTLRPNGDFFANHASGNAYAGLFNKAGASLTLPVTVDTAGRYDLAIAYSNGQPSGATVTLTASGQPAVPLTLPPTQARELFGLAHASVTLPAGTSTLTILLAAPLPVFGPSALEFDYLDVTPAAVATVQ